MVVGHRDHIEQEVYKMTAVSLSARSTTVAGSYGPTGGVWSTISRALVGRPQKGLFPSNEPASTRITFS